MNLTVLENGLVAVHITENQERVINARELHEFLESKRQFANWIQDRIEKYGFIDGEDFLTVLLESQGGRPRTEYLLKMDVAKEIAMVENNDQGRKVRQYFIEVERRYRVDKQLQEPLTSTDLIIAAAQRIKAVEIKQKEHDDQLKVIQHEQAVIKGKVDIINDHEFTIMGYANLQNVPVTNKTANRLGRMAARLSRDNGLPIGTVAHPVFGRVNTYHVDVLDDVFDELQQ